MKHFELELTALKPSPPHPSEEWMCIVEDYRQNCTHEPGAFLAATVWGGQRGGHICIREGARIPNDIVYDRVSGVI